MLSLDSMYTDSMLSQIFRYVFKAIMEALRRLALGTVEEQQMVRTEGVGVVLLVHLAAWVCEGGSMCHNGLGCTHRTHFFHCVFVSVLTQ